MFVVLGFDVVSVVGNVSFILDDCDVQDDSCRINWVGVVFVWVEGVVGLFEGDQFFQIFYQVISCGEG